MAKQKNNEGNFVKKETMLIVAVIALVIGFLGGIFYSAFQTGPYRKCADCVWSCWSSPTAATVATKPVK